MSAIDNELKTIKYTVILVGLAVAGGLAWGAWKRRKQKNNFNNLVGTNFVWQQNQIGSNWCQKCYDKGCLCLGYDKTCDCSSNKK